MSHFPVAIITKGKPTEAVLAAMLAPYDENKEVLHFTSREDLIKQKRKEISDFVESNYARYLADKEKYIAECTNANHVKYITEEFPKNFCGLTKNAIRMLSNIRKRKTFAKTVAFAAHTILIPSGIGIKWADVGLVCLL